MSSPSNMPKEDTFEAASHLPKLLTAEPNLQGHVSPPKQAAQIPHRKTTRDGDSLSLIKKAYSFLRRGLALGDSILVSWSPDLGSGVLDSWALYFMPRVFFPLSLGPTPCPHLHSSYIAFGTCLLGNICIYCIRQFLCDMQVLCKLCVTFGIPFAFDTFKAASHLPKLLTAEPNLHGQVSPPEQAAQVPHRKTTRDGDFSSTIKEDYSFLRRRLALRDSLLVSWSPDLGFLGFVP
ncbi:unnamed protein product [Prunus brigantina]